MKPVPVMVTFDPAIPLVGVNDVMVGGLPYVKTPALVPVPAGVVTLIVPVDPFEGTVAVIWVEELTVNVVLAPLNRT